MKRAFLLAAVAVIALTGCSVGWRKSLPRPPERSLDETVEARRKADAKTKECVLRQSVRRQQIERDRDVRSFRKEKC
jgi:hypothetical protein